MCLSTEEHAALQGLSETVAETVDLAEQLHAALTKAERDPVRVIRLHPGTPPNGIPLAARKVAG